MNIILFGPPGIGKSTIVGALKSRGTRAIDLEDLYPSSIRFQLPSMVDGVVFGGADLNPRRSYKNTIKVLLTMEQSAYEARRAARDARVPGKASQAKHLLSSWRKGAKYDVELDVGSKSPQQLAVEIPHLEERRKHESNEA